MVTVKVNAGSLVAFRNQAHAGAKNEDAPLAEENFGDLRMLSFGSLWANRAEPGASHSAGRRWGKAPF